MCIAEMILGCLLLGQTTDPVPPPTLRPMRSPAVLEPAVRASEERVESGEWRAEGAEGRGEREEGRGTKSAGLSISQTSDLQIPASSSPSSFSKEDATNFETAAAPSKTRLLPPERVVQAMTLPEGSALTGQPWTLQDVLATTPDRRQQLELVRTYWELARAVGEYRYCWEYAQGVERLAASAAQGEASIRHSRASAAAMLRRAELEVVQVQCELARLARLPSDAALPLPADRPHAGGYRTHFQELFAGKTPPEITVPVDRILPLRRQAIDEQAAAVEAAEDSCAAALDDCRQRRGDAAVAATCAEELLHEQRAFLRCVCDYNRNIAEYGLAVAGPTAGPQALVAILIGPTPQEAAPAMTADERGTVRRAGASLPAAAPAPAVGGWQKTEPTLAPPEQPPRETVPEQPPQSAIPSEGLRSLGGKAPALSPLRDEFARPASFTAEPLAPLEPLAPPQTRTAKKPVTEGERGNSPLYAALRDVAPAVRAKQLTAALHGDRSLPEGIGRPISLADCLLRDPGVDRLATIEAYWRLRERAAEYQLYVEQADLFEALVPLALERRSEPSGPTEMLRLQAAQLAAKARVRDAHVALVEAQYALAVRVGAGADAVWPLAATPPHSGSYLLMLESQPRAVLESWPVRRLAATIPACAAAVQQQAEAVVEADAARADAAERYRTGRVAVDSAIEGVAAQTRQSLAMLAALSDYNRAIAEYVLAVMPSGTPAHRLAAALVLKP